jgi:hypothetical protein
LEWGEVVLRAVALRGVLEELFQFDGIVQDAVFHVSM